MVVGKGCFAPGRRHRPSVLLQAYSFEEHLTTLWEESRIQSSQSVWWEELERCSQDPSWYHRELRDPTA